MSGERLDDLRGLDLEQVLEGRAPGADRRDAQRANKLVRSLGHGHGSRGRRDEDRARLAVSGDRAADRCELDGAVGLERSGLPQDVCGCEGGVAAELELRRRREPAQRPAASVGRHE